MPDCPRLPRPRRRRRVKHIPSVHMIRKTILFTRSLDEPEQRWNAVGGWDFGIRLTEPIRAVNAYLCPDLTQDPLLTCLCSLSWMRRDDSWWLADDFKLENRIQCEYNGPTLSLKALFLTNLENLRLEAEAALPDILYCYLVIV